MKHLIRSSQLSRQELLSLFDRANEFLPVVKERRKLKLAEGKILATLFFEPSTRTRFSFETAMLRLGGDVISNPQMLQTSSAKKGESLYDTGRTVSQYADVIALRHPEAQAIHDLVEGARVPVVNGGNGPEDHPTQGLLDLFTILEEKGRLDDLTIAMVGDLKHSRVVHSQCELLSHFSHLRFILVSPEGLRMPPSYVTMLQEKGFEVTETEELHVALEACDVLSDTRIQQERFASEEDYLKHKGVYILTPELMQKAKPDMILIDPLPRVDHIHPSVDSDPRAKYFDQVQNGVALRMAVLAELMGLC